jgi:hypothetical protein
MSCCDYECNQGRDCPVRAKPPAPLPTAAPVPLYRRCDVHGVCQSPDAECNANCLLHDQTHTPALDFQPWRQPLAHSWGDWALLVAVAAAATATVSFVLGLYADQIASALLWLAEGVTRLVQRFAAWPLGWN